ncbi:3-hydroxyacyl-[acyl-carrier-protein] dehydratase [Saccharothrix carnea]|uniref:3-hydroxyacyl-[acyl-carrier-protein] dehydratase n=1 Tax=Saccharothrix carnea TaxID=1280637 RepID=A0A2P8I3K8_SACCR|nr:beta-hydroxyacyl-ACP dehydratase [Saccharothrix carnea]PSL53052.1 3-hydroxyacyl-[acyl-carrier-protein] dehydratase [Saccharothrix carnea]
MTGRAGTDLLRLLPHRHPLLLVDRVLDVVPGESLTALKAVSANEPWCVDLGDFPPTLLLESWCQAAVLLSSWDEPATDRVVLFGAMADVKFHRPVSPGCVVRHSVRVLDARGATVAFTGRSEVDGHVVMTVGRVVTTARAAADLHS